MLDIFNAIGDFFTTIYNIINFIFNGLKLLFTLLTSGIQFLFNVVATLPVPFIAGATALIVVCVLYKVLGRENQS